MKRISLIVLIYEILLLGILIIQILSPPIIFPGILVIFSIPYKHSISFQQITPFIFIYLIPIIYTYFSLRENQTARKIILSLSLLAIGAYWIQIAYTRYTVLSKFGDSYGAGDQNGAFIENSVIAGGFIFSSAILWIPKIGNYAESFARILAVSLIPLILSYLTLYLPRAN